MSTKVIDNKVILTENVMVYEDSKVKVITNVDPAIAQNPMIGDITVLPGDTIITTEGVHLIKNLNGTYTNVSAGGGGGGGAEIGTDFVLAGPDALTPGVLEDGNNNFLTSGEGFFKLPNTVDGQSILIQENGNDIGSFVGPNIPMGAVYAVYDQQVASGSPAIYTNPTDVLFTIDKTATYMIYDGSGIASLLGLPAGSKLYAVYKIGQTPLNNVKSILTTGGDPVNIETANIRSSQTLQFDPTVDNEVYVFNNTEEVYKLILLQNVNPSLSIVIQGNIITPTGTDTSITIPPNQSFLFYVNNDDNLILVSQPSAGGGGSGINTEDIFIGNRTVTVGGNPTPANYIGFQEKLLGEFNYVGIPEFDDATNEQSLLVIGTGDYVGMSTPLNPTSPIILTTGASIGSTGPVLVNTGNSSVDGDSGSINLTTGDGFGSSRSSGPISIKTGSASSNAVSGRILLETGSSDSDENGGAVIVSTGINTGDGRSGNVVLSTGQANGNSGQVIITTGESLDQSGNMTISTGGSSPRSGQVVLGSGNNSQESGPVVIQTGSAELQSGDVTIRVGNSDSIGGNINLITPPNQLGLVNVETTVFRTSSGRRKKISLIAESPFVVQNSDHVLIAELDASVFNLPLGVIGQEFIFKNLTALDITLDAAGDNLFDNGAGLFTVPVGASVTIIFANGTWYTFL